MGGTTPAGPTGTTRVASSAGLVLAALAALAAAACTSTGGAPSTAPATDPLPKQAAVGQAWALGDGVVTRNEYQTAVSRFRACMAAAGYRSTKPMLSPIDSLTLLYDLEPTGDAKIWNATVERCNLTHLSHIEPGYVDKHEQVMVQPLREAAAGCLTERGVKLTGAERNVADFLAAEKRTPVVMDCVLGPARKLFPRLPREVSIRT